MTRITRSTFSAVDFHSTDHIVGKSAPPDGGGVGTCSKIYPGMLDGPTSSFYLS